MVELAGLELVMLGDIREPSHRATPLGARGVLPQHRKLNCISSIPQHKKLSLGGCAVPQIVAKKLMVT